MNRLILRALNAPILILITALAIAVQTSLFTSFGIFTSVAAYPLRLIEPDFVLFVVIWCALRRDFTEGGVITLIVSEIAELHTSAPKGVFLIGYMALYLVLRAADKLFVLPTEPPMWRISVASSAFLRGCVTSVLLLLVGRRYAWRQPLLHLLPGMLIAAVFGIWAYRWLERFDVITFKHVSEESPDEFQIENLGI